MNAKLQQRDREQSGVIAGTLTARWLLWGLPAQLGLAVSRELSDKPVTSDGGRFAQPDQLIAGER